jgi:hypothetical protein
MIPGEHGNAFEAWQVWAEFRQGVTRLTLLAVDLCASKFQCGDEFREAGASRPGSQARAWRPVKQAVFTLTPNSPPRLMDGSTTPLL